MPFSREAAAKGSAIANVKHWSGCPASDCPGQCAILWLQLPWLSCESAGVSFMAPLITVLDGIPSTACAKLSAVLVSVVAFRSRVSSLTLHAAGKLWAFLLQLVTLNAGTVASSLWPLWTELIKLLHVSARDSCSRGLVCLTPASACRQPAAILDSDHRIGPLHSRQAWVSGLATVGCKALHGAVQCTATACLPPRCTLELRHILCAPHWKQSTPLLKHSTHSSAPQLLS